MKHLRLLALVLSLFVVAGAASAADTISYTSQPDQIVVFLNNIAFAQDDITLPGGVDMAVVLPEQVFTDTVVLREDGERVASYRMDRSEGRPTLRWTSESGSDVRQVTLTYLLAGVGWTPRYDMWLAEDETVGFDFYAEIVDNALTLEDVDIRLVAGRVDTMQQMDEISRVTTNQYIAGYDRAGAGFTGAATIQHVYAIDPISAIPGETVYTRLVTAELPARRVHLWNAQSEPQVDVIYKVRNETEIPFAEGIVRSYENGLFVGSDFVELTPIGGEGSVTVGNLQNVRVNRSETRTAIAPVRNRDTQHDVVLELTNFGDTTITIEVVDYFPPDAIEFAFSQEPERQKDNLFRWEVTLEPGATVEISYGFKNY
jgi:hypothetical protein